MIDGSGGGTGPGYSTFAGGNGGDLTILTPSGIKVEPSLDITVDFFG